MGIRDQLAVIHDSGLGSQGRIPVTSRACGFEINVCIDDRQYKALCNISSDSGSGDVTGMPLVTTQYAAKDRQLAVLPP